MIISNIVFVKVQLGLRHETRRGGNEIIFWTDGWGFCLDRVFFFKKWGWRVGWNLRLISWEMQGVGAGWGTLYQSFESWVRESRGDILLYYNVSAASNMNKERVWGWHKVIQTKNTIFSFQSYLIWKLVCFGLVRALSSAYICLDLCMKRNGLRQLAGLAVLALAAWRCSLVQAGRVIKFERDWRIFTLYCRGFHVKLIIGLTSQKKRLNSLTFIVVKCRNGRCLQK